MKALNLTEMMTQVTLLSKEPRPVEVVTEVKGDVEKMM